jgi:hypothetical protein
MQADHPSPFSWITQLLTALQWPVIVVAAFFAGRYISSPEDRLDHAEKNIKDLIERHMPHIHNALGDVKTKLDVITAMLVSKRGQITR